MPPEAFLRVEALSKRYRRADSGIGLRPRSPLPYGRGSESRLGRGSESRLSGAREQAEERNHAVSDLASALHDVSFDLGRGRTLGLVGVSGAGKSTLARCLALVDPPDSGRIFFEGQDLWAAGRKERAALRARVQLIPQQPAASLNPRFTAAQIVAEPLVIQRLGTPADRRAMAARWMKTVGLPLEALDTRALQFSGGERQRLAIARALILEPALLILDESFAGLDLSVQGHIAQLLRDLRREMALTCILITHDLALAASLADEIAVMDAGRIVESGPVAEVVAHPSHARTRELLDAAMALSLEDAG